MREAGLTLPHCLVVKRDQFGETVRVVSLELRVRLSEQLLQTSDVAVHIQSALLLLIDSLVELESVLLVGLNGDCNARFAILGAFECHIGQLQLKRLRLHLRNASVLFPLQLLLYVRQVRLATLPMLFLLLEPLYVRNETFLAQNHLLLCSRIIHSSAMASYGAVQSDRNTAIFLLLGA